MKYCMCGSFDNENKIMSGVRRQRRNTSNSLDEIFRHSITIMSQLHFVSAKKYYDRVLQLGKNKNNVFLSGSLSVCNIKQILFPKSRN